MQRIKAIKEFDAGYLIVSTTKPGIIKTVKGFIWKKAKIVFDYKLYGGK